MPLIPESFRNSVFYLYRTSRDADAGERNGGTGFFVSVKDEEELPPFLYAVSNWHVVGPPPLENAPVARVNTKAGGHETLDGLTWIQHTEGDDLAIARVGLAPEHFSYSAVHSDLVMAAAEHGSEGEAAARKIWGPGNEVFFVGRYADHEGREQNEPIVRFGNIASMPDDEKIHNEALQIDQESYIVEARSIGGFSGSPVFVNPQTFIDDDGQWDFYMGGRTALLGVIWGHTDQFQRVLGPDQETPLPDVEWVKQNVGLMYAVPSWRLREMLMEEDEMAKRRKHAEGVAEESKRKSRGVALDALEASPFRQSDFEDALQRVTRKVADPPPKKRKPR
jgi:Trypsin-like peptidase domain